MDIEVQQREPITHSASGHKSFDLVAGDNIKITVAGNSELDWKIPVGKIGTLTIRLSGTLKDAE